MKRVLLPAEDTEHCVLWDEETGEEFRVTRLEWRAMVHRYRPEVTEQEFNAMWERLHAMYRGARSH